MWQFLVFFGCLDQVKIWDPNAWLGKVCGILAGGWFDSLKVSKDHFFYEGRRLTFSISKSLASSWLRWLGPRCLNDFLFFLSLFPAQLLISRLTWRRQIPSIFPEIFVSQLDTWEIWGAPSENQEANTTPHLSWFSIQLFNHPIVWDPAFFLSGFSQAAVAFTCLRMDFTGIIAWWWIEVVIPVPPTEDNFLHALRSYPTW